MTLNASARDIRSASQERFWSRGNWNKHGRHTLKSPAQHPDKSVPLPICDCNGFFGQWSIKEVILSVNVYSCGKNILACWQLFEIRMYWGRKSDNNMSKRCLFLRVLNNFICSGRLYIRGWGCFGCELSGVICHGMSTNLVLISQGVPLLYIVSHI